MFAGGGDEAPEWMRILGGTDAKRHSGADVTTTDTKDDDAMDDSEFPEDIASEGDAAALLAAVKQRLAERNQGAKYHEFLAAVSSDPVDYEAASAIVEGHADLSALLKSCFGDGARVSGVVGNEKAASLPQEPAVDRRGPKARISQLVQLIFGSKAGVEKERTRVAEYAKLRAAKPAFPRRLFVLRGPPGLGKSTHAERALTEEVNEASEDLLAARLTHICAADDFSMQHVGNKSSESKYVFDPQSAGVHNLMNEARVRFAMEIGIEPLYVDGSNMRLLDMHPYVMLADRMGYIVTVVSPHEISPSWGDIDFLVDRNAAKKDRRVGRAALETMLQQFEDLTGAEDPRPAIRAAEPAEEEESHGQSLVPPGAILYKFEKLLKEGSELMRYRPADGKGWGVNGELLGEWHSFRERGDGSCCYSDGRRDWHTGAPEESWSFTDLAMLEDLRKETESVPEAPLPSAVSHPSLFSNVERKAAGVGAAMAPASSKKRPPPPPVSDEAVPAMSRKERFKQRVLERVQEEEDTRAKQRPAKQARVNGARAAPAVTAAVAPTSLELPKPGVPTQQEEMSAATFLAAVKSRLTEWGKLDQYHEFVVALSGSVDAKAAVRILMGHDDLLRVFRSKFAPRSDLIKIKAELQEEEAAADEPRPPATAPRAAVKQELGAVTGRRGLPPMAGADRPHAPAGPPPNKVKQELGRGQSAVKAELGAVKGENIPRPPNYDPHAPRRTVTIGDDSDDEIPDETKLAAAARKGRESCIAELAKTIFRKERAAHQGARQRLAMVRYATKRSARPRFPRELFILRGAPGVGKSDYAMQRLHETAGLESGEELPARLTHVCAVDDFFERFTADGTEYEFQAGKLETNHLRNEARVRLAMEAGIHPLFVDCPNLKLWEMKPYVELGERLGYVVTIVEPTAINERAEDQDYLVSACDTASRRAAGKVVSRGAIAPMLASFERVSNDEDGLDAIRAASRPAAALRLVEAVPTPPEPAAGVDGGPRPSAPGPAGKGGARPSGKSGQRSGATKGQRSAGGGGSNAAPAWVQVKTESTQGKGGVRW